MAPAKKLASIIDYFLGNNPFPETELLYLTEYELCVAVILSAQCTDKRVNMITPAFFRKFEDFQSLAQANFEEVFELIRSCSYPNNKSKHLMQLANELVLNFNGKLPMEFEKLITLPGIGRKTANVLLSVLGKADAFAVDTHVFRVTHRLGLVNNSAKTPYAVEMQILSLVKNPEILNSLHHWLILHGRYVCQARKPKCSECGIAKFCNYYQKQSRTD